MLGHAMRHYGTALAALYCYRIDTCIGRIWLRLLITRCVSAPGVECSVITVRVHNERRRRRCACENAAAMANDLGE